MKGKREVPLSLHLAQEVAFLAILQSRHGCGGTNCALAQTSGPKRGLQAASGAGRPVEAGWKREEAASGSAKATSLAPQSPATSPAPQANILTWYGFDAWHWIRGHCTMCVRES